ncbi:MAG: translation initiation factor IF-2 [Dehalococcoidales bacterium]|nr:translation initiation factor IF-2 [Dehalococcoidales bacterium]
MPRPGQPERVVEPAAKAGGAPPTVKPAIEIPHSITVRQLADLFHVDAVDIIKQLMRMGVMANINQVINYEAAAGVAKNLGLEVRPKPLSARKASVSEFRQRQQLKGGEGGNLQPRPPVVTVMGHVDHGKTRTLDAIRQTNVMATEAGGITQHIGAYQVMFKEQKITFLDTPGHEAFTAMRAHGAQITDIVVLVVAADDGVQPQTLEALNHARAAGVPIIVAINKIDKPSANPDLVKQQLADAGLVVEEWGGEAIAVPISAKEKKGIPELLESVLLVSEMLELKADPTRPARGVVIEAKLDKSRGPLATVLIQNGTLSIGDTIVVGTSWGRVKAMFNDLGKRVRKAEPSTPTEILGLDSVPQVGDVLTGVADEHAAQALVSKNRQAQENVQAEKSVSLTTLFDQINAGKVKELNLILKADVQGSIEPIRASLERLGTEAVKLRIIHAGTGNITESDVMLAIASKGLIVGFNVSADEGARNLAHSKGIDIRIYRVIYDLINDVDKAVKGLLEPTYVEVIEGRADVREVFPAGKGMKAAGSYVTEGKITRGSSARLRRGKEVVIEATIASLRRFKEDIREAATGFECGIVFKDFNDFKAGDVIEAFKMEKQE